MAIGWIGYNIVVWRTAEFAVTNLRVIREEGFISRRSSATLLSSVSDVKSSVGLLGKTLGYGDLAIYTQSGEAGADRFTTITQPEAFRNAIMTHKMGDVRGPAAGTAGAAPAAGPAVPTAAAPAASRLLPTGASVGSVDGRRRRTPSPGCRRTCAIAAAITAAGVRRQARSARILARM